MSSGGTAEKLTCQQADEWLVDFLYGELPVEQSELFSQHLKECAAHRAEVASLRAVLSLVRQQPAEVPEELTKRISAAARRRVSSPFSPHRSWWWWLSTSPLPAALAAGVAVVILSVALWRLGEQKPSEQEPVDYTRSVTVVAESPPPPPEMSAEPVVEKTLPAPAPVIAAEPAGSGKTDEALPSVRPRAKDMVASRKAPAATQPLPKKKAGLADTATGAEAWMTADAKGEGRRAAPAKTAGSPAEADESLANDKLAQAQTIDGRMGEKEAALARKPRRVVTKIAEASPPAAPPATPAVPEQAPAAEAKPAVKETAAESAADLVRARDEEEARSQPERLPKGAPTDAEAEFERARVFMQAGDCLRQIPAAKKAVAAAPRHSRAAPTMLDQASCLVKLQRFDEARQLYLRIEREYPDYADEARAGLRRLEGK